MTEAALRGRTERAAPLVAYLVVAALSVGFQAAYVYLPAADVHRRDGYDVLAHESYLKFVRTSPENPLAFKGSYVWVHFPAFYRLNSFFADLACREPGVVGPCMWNGVRLGWFLQGVLRAVTLAVLLLTFRRLFPAPWLAAAALALCGTSPRIFFTTCIWNQDEYVFFFAAVCMYLTVTAIQQGLSVPRLVASALAVAFGFAFKLTMLIPAGAMLVAFVLLPRRRATPGRKLAALAAVVLCVAAVNWSLFATPEGRARLLWTGTTQYPNRLLNSQDAVRAFLTLQPAPWLRPEPIYVRNMFDPLGQVSFTTAAYLYVFELYDHFQGPPRTWLNLICVWTGTPLFVLIVIRMAATGLRFLRRRGPPLEDVYATTLVLLSAAGIVYLSLHFPYGWVAHPEYVVAAYPAATYLALRQLTEVRSPRLRLALWSIAAVHLVANLAMIARAASFKIAAAG